MQLGTFEIVAIAVIALLFFGPSKLPSIGKSIGEGIRGFKKGMNEVQNTLNEREDQANRTQTTAKTDDKDKNA